MPDTLEALGILVLFFVPGFVATQVYVRNDPTADASHPKYLLSVAVWSAIVHVVVFGSSWRVRSCPPAGRRRPAGWQAREEVPRGGQS